MVRPRSRGGVGNLVGFGIGVEGSLLMMVVRMGSVGRLLMMVVMNLMIVMLMVGHNRCHPSIVIVIMISFYVGCCHWWLSLILM